MNLLDYRKWNKISKFSKMKKIPLVGNLFLYYKYNKTTMEKNMFDSERYYKLENNKDFLDNIATVEDFSEMIGQSIADRIKKDPIYFANKLRKDNFIYDEEYKEIIMNIKKQKLKEDF